MEITPVQQLSINGSQEFKAVFSAFTAAVPPVADIHKAIGNTPVDETVLPLPLELAIVRRPGERAQLELEPGITLVDLDAREKAAAAQQEAAAAEAAAAAAAEEDAKQRKYKRSESRSGRMTSAKKATSLSLSSTKPKSRSKDDVEGFDRRQSTAFDDVLKTPRWVVPANGSATVRVRFVSDKETNVTRTLQFQDVVSGRVFPVDLTCVCEFPHLNTDPKSLFPASAIFNGDPASTVVKKKFVASAERIEFGPVLCGKSREDFKGERFQENVFKLNLTNPGVQPVTVASRFENDTNFTTFTLDPANAVIEAGQALSLRVFAYPKSTNDYSDKLMITLGSNPKPLVFAVHVEGSEPALELDKKQIAFEKVLINHKSVKTLQLTNKTKLPVAYNLAGVEQLGDEFSADKLAGVVSPLSSATLNISYLPVRTANLKKV